MDKRLQYILLFAFVLNTALVISNFQNRTYDSFEHIFFADHYRDSWFDTWEQKWYGGFTVTSYPPLAHQSVALLSYVVSLEWSYKIVTLVLMTLFPLAVYQFSKIFMHEEAAIFASIIAVFVPSVFQAAYSFGQLPTIFGLVVGLFTVVYLAKFLRSNSKLDLLISLALLGVSVSAHHFTAVFLIPTLVGVLALSFLVHRVDIPAKILMKRVLIFSSLGIVLSLVVIYPYWLFTLTNPVNAPIPHLSRIDIFLQDTSFSLFFWNMYGVIIFLVPALAFFSFKKRYILPLFAVTLLMLVLGLGGTTPLPELLFGSSWEVLTYDRFALWASVLLLPLCGYFLAENIQRIFSRKRYKILLAAFFAALALTSVYSSNLAINSPYPVSVANVDPVIDFLNAPQTQNWRYLTLGLGEPAMLKVYVYSSAKTVDGYYFFVRTDPLLSQSGVGQLDSAKYYGEKGLSTLNLVLANSENESLRWVICADPTYYPLLANNSFTQRWTQDSTGDYRFGGVTIWEYNGTIPEYVPKSKQDSSVINSLMWGILPPLMLFTALAAILVENYKQKEIKIAKKL